MGFNISTTTASTEVRMLASGAVTAGDLVVNAEGSAVKAAAALSVAQLNNTTVGLSAIYPVTDRGVFYGDTGVAYKRICESGSGDILEVFTGDGTASATTGVRLATRSAAGVNTQPLVTVSNAAACSTPRIKRLTAGTVLIAWTESAVLKFAIYNNNGTVAVAAATVATLPNTAYGQWNMSVLAGGDIVFAYTKVTSLNTTFARYNASGVLQGAEVTVEASANSSAGICVLPQAAGGFVVYYYRTAATVGYKFARYDATGTLQGSLTTISTGSPAAFTFGDHDNLAIELSNGNIVFQWSNAAHNYSVYSSAGALVTTVATLATTAAGTNTIHGLVQNAIGGFVALTWGSAIGTATFRSFSASGLLVASSTFNMTVQNGQPLVVPTAQGFCVLTSIDDGASSTAMYLANISSTGSLVGSVVTLATGAVAFADLCLLRQSSGLAVVGYKLPSGNGQLPFAVYNPDKTSVIGVALESVASGASVRIATKGTYAINQVMGGGSFDQRAATVPGTKGAIVGSTAQLYGAA